MLGLLTKKGGGRSKKPRVWKWPNEVEDDKIAASFPAGTYEPNGEERLHWLKADQVSSKGLLRSSFRSSLEGEADFDDVPSFLSRFSQVQTTH